MEDRDTAIQLYRPDRDPLRQSCRQGWLVCRVVGGVGGGGALGRLVEDVLR